MNINLLDFLNEQNIAACRLDEMFGTVDANTCLKEQVSHQDLFSAQKLDFFTPKEKRKIDLCMESKQQTKLDFVPKKLQKTFSEAFVCKDDLGFICTFKNSSRTNSSYTQQSLIDAHQENERLQSMLQSFKSLFKHNKVAFIQFNRLGTVVDSISEQFSIFLTEPTCGTAFQDIFPKDLSIVLWEKMMAAKNSDEPFHLEYHLNQDSLNQWFVLDLTPLASGSVLTIRDISRDKERMTMEVENDRLTTLGILAGGLAHQFNNIHHVILGNLDLIDFVETQEQLEDCLDTVKRSILKASCLTNKLLSFSRSKKKSIKAYSLEDVIQSSFEFTEEKFLKSNVDFEFEKQEDQNYFGMIDLALFEQVLINLMINSIQAKDEQKLHSYVKIRLSTHSNSDEIICDIIDNGTGIEPQNQKKVFTPLFTTKGEFSKARGDADKGTGLGLSLSKRLISDMQGRLELLESSPEGTTFRLFLKQARGKKHTSISRGPRSLELDPESPFKVAIFDDEFDTRKFLCSYFETFKDCEIIEYSDGDIDFKELGAARPDVILLDWLMPNKNGNYVLETLNLESKDLLAKTIVISGHIPDHEFDPWAQTVGNKLAKPLSIDKLNEAIFKL